MTAKPNIACIGEVMIELVADDNETAKLGVAGDTYNTAVYLKKLGKEALDVSYVTALGNDSFSKRILKRMQHFGLETENVEIRPDRIPGLYAIDTDSAGERSFTYWRSQSAARTLFQAPCTVELEHLRKFDVIYVSGITLAILPPQTRENLFGFFDTYRASGGRTVFDSNYRPRLWESLEIAQAVTSHMWSITDIALPSVDDEMELFNDNSESDVVARLKKSGVVFGALKRGSKGPLPLGDSDLQTSYPSVQSIIDTTAAGDSFNAGFLHAVLLSKPVSEALQAGHALASRVIRQKGAIVDLD